MLNPQIAGAKFRRLLLASILLLGTVALRAATGGSISGTVTDQTGAVVPDATLELVNTGQHSTYRVKSDKQGLYSFPNLGVGHYDLTITAQGFTTQRKTDLTVDTGSAVRVDATLAIGANSDTVIVSGDIVAQVDWSGSNLGEQLDPIDPRQSRAISAWDLKHVFVGSYTAALPIATLVRKSNRLTDEWSLSGTTRFTTGFPVTLFDNTNNSLLGTSGNGANNYLLETPQYLPGHLNINTNGRNGRPASTPPSSRRRLSVS
jgi:Carboxypeptidase regulatory-like domain